MSSNCVGNYELLETRFISGKGLLKVPLESQPYRRYALIADIVRLPTQFYINNNWTPPEGFYANMTFTNGRRVISKSAMKFVSQTWVFTPDPEGQAIIALKCAVDTHNQSIVNLGLAQGLPPISVNNPLEAFDILPLEWDAVRLKCHADSGIRLQLWGMPYEYCSPYSVFTADPPPDPDPPTEVPQGQPMEGDQEVSEPYEGDDDDGATQPLELDQLPEPPPPGGDSCQKYYIVVKIIHTNGSVSATQGVQAYGVIGGLRLASATPLPGNYQRLEIQCQGFYSNNGQCQPTQGWYLVRQMFFNEISANSYIESITPVP